MASIDVSASELVLITVGDDSAELEAFESLLKNGVVRLSLRTKVLVITYSAKVAKAAKAAGVESVAFVDDVTVTRTTLKWLAARVTLLAGWPTLLMDPATALMQDPSSYFVRDSDVEAASDGWDDVTAYGYDHVVDDPEMDWSRFCHGGRVLTADPGFTLLMPTEESAKLASLVAGRSESRFLGSKQSVTKTADSDFEHLVFNEAVFLPSHGAYVSPGVTRRTLNYMCFANSKHTFRFVRKVRLFYISRTGN